MADADDAREAADEQSSAANEAAALLAAERRSRAAEVNARVSARSDSARERTRESVAADTRHRARCEAATHGEGDQRRAAREWRG